MIEIKEMTLDDFENIKDKLQTEFDEFWKPSILPTPMPPTAPSACSAMRTTERPTAAVGTVHRERFRKGKSRGKLGWRRGGGGKRRPLRA